MTAKSNNSRATPGKQLLALRKRLGLSLRDVEGASVEIACKLNDRRFVIPFVRVHDLETTGRIPTIFRLYTLARIYKRHMRELLQWYGVPFR